MIDGENEWKGDCESPYPNSTTQYTIEEEDVASTDVIQALHLGGKTSHCSSMRR